MAQELKRRGAFTWAVDSARYSHALARCYVEADGREVDRGELRAALAHLDALPGREGYVTETFCRQARYFQPANGARIDAIRDALRDEFAGSRLFPILLTSLLEAADRVDSTTGLQMAYLKEWAPRASNRSSCASRRCSTAPGRRCGATRWTLCGPLPAVDLAYLDPPYNQHSYYRNYHVWETIVAWDAPGHYGVACKRDDCRDPATRSPFNSRPRFREALARVVRAVRARVLVLSYNDEAWVSLDELVELCAPRGPVAVLEFDSARYVGARIGIHDPSGRRVGRVGRLRNIEYLLVSGALGEVERAAGARARLRRAA